MVGFPRPLSALERDILFTVLPSDREAYRKLRERLALMVVLGQGKRGEGDLVLGYPGDEPDPGLPLYSVIACGALETRERIYSVTIREEAGNKVNVEIVSERGEGIPDRVDETRRWTYSSWRPGDASPATGKKVREVAISDDHILVCASHDRRLWLYDRSSGFVALLPITGFYAELMSSLGVHDAPTVMHASLFWDNVASYSDEQLRQAFIAYNLVRHRAEIPFRVRGRQSLKVPAFLKKIFTRKI
jgi:hypothetical protein